MKKILFTSALVAAALLYPDAALGVTKKATKKSAPQAQHTLTFTEITDQRFNSAYISAVKHNARGALMLSDVFFYRPRPHLNSGGIRGYNHDTVVETQNIADRTKLARLRKAIQEELKDTPNAAICSLTDHGGAREIIITSIGPHAERAAEIERGVLADDFNADPSAFTCAFKGNPSRAPFTLRKDGLRGALQR